MVKTSEHLKTEYYGEEDRILETMFPGSKECVKLFIGSTLKLNMDNTIVKADIRLLNAAGRDVSSVLCPHIRIIQPHGNWYEKKVIGSNDLGSCGFAVPYIFKKPEHVLDIWSIAIRWRIVSPYGINHAHRTQLVSCILPKFSNLQSGNKYYLQSDFDIVDGKPELKETTGKGFEDYCLIDPTGNICVNGECLTSQLIPFFFRKYFLPELWVMEFVKNCQGTSHIYGKEEILTERKCVGKSKN